MNKELTYKIKQIFNFKKHIKMIWNSNESGTFKRGTKKKTIEKRKKLKDLIPNKIERPKKMHCGESYESFRKRRKLSNTRRRLREKVRRYTNYNITV